MAETNWAALAAKAAEAPGGGTYDPLPPAKYPVKVTGAEARDTTTGKKMFVLEFTVLSGQFEGRKVWTNIVISPENAVALSIAFRHLSCLGVSTDFLATEPDDGSICAKLIDQTATVQVVLRKDDASRNDVKDIQPQAGGDPLASAPAAAAPGGAAATTAPPDDPF